MSETSPRRVLHLIMDGCSPDQLEHLITSSQQGDRLTQVLSLTETNAAEALEKIFAAQTIAVWGEVSRPA
jgi:hypothetical protein